jgi:hypothetical protein
MADSDAALRAAAAAIKQERPELTDADADKIARSAVGGWMAVIQAVPSGAAEGTVLDWDPGWPPPPGWRVEVYPTTAVDPATTRHDRMHAAARIVKS